MSSVNNFPEVVKEAQAREHEIRHCTAMFYHCVMLQNANADFTSNGTFSTNQAII